MKINTKKQLNLPQLIEWGFKQEVLPPMFHGSRNGSVVQFTPGGWVNINGIEPIDTFTIEVEEEITEDTVMPKLIELYSNEAKNTFVEHHRDRTIKQIQDEGGCKSLAFYILNDDLTMTLIWRDGKLVE